MSEERWSYSRDQERFHGEYPTWWDAVLDNTKDDPEAGCYVGLSEPPLPPEDADEFGDLIIEHVQIQDGYSGEWAEDWPNASEDQIVELNAAVRLVFAAWLDRHQLRPTFWTVPKSQWRTRREALEAQEEAMGAKL